MTFDEWSALPYERRLSALAETVLDGYRWDWLDSDMIMAFFEDSPDAEARIFKYVDISRLDTFFVQDLMDDGVLDMGLSPREYSEFKERIEEDFGATLTEADQSQELEMLHSIGAVFLEKKILTIYAASPDGEPLFLRLTTWTYSDTDDLQVADPWCDDEEHASMPEQGEWYEYDAELVDPAAELNAILSRFRDIDEVGERTSAELSNLFGDGFDLGLDMNGQSSSPGGLGDSIDDEDQ